MSDLQKFVLAFIVVVCAALACGFCFKIGKHEGYRNGYKDGQEVVVNKTDTIWKTDTHYIDNPIEVIRWKDKLVYVPVTDSVIIHQHDTTYVALEFEKVEYADSTYKAVVSGFQPKLDWIEVYPKTAYITNTIVERRHFGASVTAGPAVVWSFNGKVYAGLGAAIGLSYNF